MESFVPDFVVSYYNDKLVSQTYRFEKNLYTVWNIISPLEIVKFVYGALVRLQAAIEWTILKNANA